MDLNQDQENYKRNIIKIASLNKGKFLSRREVNNSEMFYQNFYMIYGMTDDNNNHIINI